MAALALGNVVQNGGKLRVRVDSETAENQPHAHEPNYNAKDLVYSLANPIGDISLAGVVIGLKDFRSSESVVGPGLTLGS
jgi:hypothetical protein